MEGKTGGAGQGMGIGTMKEMMEGMGGMSPMMGG